MTHVTVGNAIDWQQMNLDQSVRSIRMWIDKERDLYAVPVIVIDPTKEKIVTGVSAPTPWYGYGTMSLSMGIIVFHTPPVGRSSWITKVAIDFANSNMAGGNVNEFFFQTQDGLTQLFRTYQWIPAAATIRPTWVMDFSAHPIPAGISGVVLGMTVDLVGGSVIMGHCWGYDV